MASTTALPLLVVLLAAQALAFPPKTSGLSNVIDTAEAAGAKVFSDAVRKSPMVKTLLESATGLTVFAFTDKAYTESPAALKKFLNTTDGLQSALEYHVSVGVTTGSKDLRDNLLLISDYPSGASLSLQLMRVNIYNIPTGKAEASSQVVTVSGAPIVKADLQASNGLVHIIDKVMFPIPVGDNMVQFLSKDARFSTLVTFLEKAKLTTALATDPTQPFTLFAPNNAAFEKLPKAVVQKLSNVTFLTEVLEYHVVKGALYAAGLYNNQKLHPLFDREILVVIGKGGVFVENQQVIQTDTTITNGVVHEVSGVLIPPPK